MKYCEIQPTYYLAVLSIANNESIYIKEWLEWHKKYGVEKFFIYDNGSTNNTYEVLRPYIESDVVESIYFPGKNNNWPPMMIALKNTVLKPAGLPLLIWMNL